MIERVLSALPVVLVLLLLLCMTAPACGAPSDPLKTLRPQHPRLFLLADGWTRLKTVVQTDALAKKWFTKLLAEAQALLSEKPVVHELIGPRLLDKSRTALRRISTLAALHRLTGDKRFADRAVEEMLAVVAFADWNPSHFLDTAEMSAAVGIGYDWLFDWLSADQRKTIRGGLVELGLGPGLDGFTKSPPAWWTRARHNWGQVCMGGLSVGALAIADEEPALCGDLLTRCREAIVPSMNAFAPDGGCAEGPGYWGYATQYHVYYLAAIESALGTDLGLKKIPGVSEAGWFRIHSIGPLNRTFNFADAKDGAGSTPQMLWLAGAFHTPAFAEHEIGLTRDRAQVFHLLWLPDGDKTRSVNPNQQSLDALFRGVQVAFFRSDWTDTATYVGFKGGDNKANHSHLDLGTFVLDALGQRWAVDLGPDNYNLPAYFGKERWTYYRLRTEGHNTLTIGGQNQNTDAKAPIIAYKSGDARALAVADLTDGYRPAARKAMRGLALLERARVLIQDEVSLKSPAQVEWTMHTPAAIALAGASATLTQEGATLEARILAPAGAKFEVADANPPKPQAQQPGIKRLMIRVPGAADATIAVLLSPGGQRKALPALQPLSEWIKYAQHR